MSDVAEANWLLPMIVAIRVRPGMFLGDESVKTLGTYFSGYETARQDLGFEGMTRQDEELLDAFCSWLAEKTQRPQGSAGWPELVQRIDDSNRNVRTFFILLEEFLQSRGESLDRIEPWQSPAWMLTPDTVSRKT